MTTDQQHEAQRQLATGAARPNPLGPYEYRVIEKKRFIPFPGAEPHMVVVSDTRCVF